MLKDAHVSFDASFVLPKVDTANAPSAPNWIGSTVSGDSTRKGRQLRAKINRWVYYSHAVATQVALNVIHTDAQSESLATRFSMVHWHPAFLSDALTQGWTPGTCMCDNVIVRECA